MKNNTLIILAIILFLLINNSNCQFSESFSEYTDPDLEDSIDTLRDNIKVLAKEIKELKQNLNKRLGGVGWEYNVMMDLCGRKC
tara:strand:+ start:658 stop:909 length:252 start_codon:yes stop_codon:yes gene_type:complete